MFTKKRSVTMVRCSSSSFKRIYGWFHWFVHFSWVRESGFEEMLYVPDDHHDGDEDKKADGPLNNGFHVCLWLWGWPYAVPNCIYSILYWGVKGKINRQQNKDNLFIYTMATHDLCLRGHTRSLSKDARSMMIVRPCGIRDTGFGVQG